jgi:predicted Zn-dependent protease with MMP-like domain
MDDDEFEEQVEAAIESLPPEFAARLSNVAIMVEPRPTSHHRRIAGIKPWQSLYGLYQGIPLPARHSNYALVAPDVITIFSEPLRRDFPSAEQLRAQIRRTVIHEIAHHFGMSDDWLREIGAY